MAVFLHSLQSPRSGKHYPKSNLVLVSLKLAPVEGNKYDYGGPLLGVLIIFFNVVLYGPQFLKKHASSKTLHCLIWKQPRTQVALRGSYAHFRPLREAFSELQPQSGLSVLKRFRVRVFQVWPITSDFGSGV